MCDSGELLALAQAISDEHASPEMRERFDSQIKRAGPALQQAAMEIIRKHGHGD